MATASAADDDDVVDDDCGGGAAVLNPLAALLFDEECLIRTRGCAELDEVRRFTDDLLRPATLAGVAVGFFWLTVLVGLSQAPAVPLSRRLQHYAALLRVRGEQDIHALRKVKLAAR